MREISNDAFYDFIKQYDQDREHHLVGEVDYYLLTDDKPYEGLRSHREALLFAFDLIAEKDIEDQERARELLGDRIADKLHSWVYDVDKAKATPLTSRVFFYCPNIVKTD